MLSHGSISLSSSFFSNFCLVTVPWMKISQASSSLKTVSFIETASCLVIAIALHLLMLLWHASILFTVKSNKKSPTEFRAVLFVASQKTLLFAVTVISFLNEDEVGELGLITIPCILMHFSQAMIDAPISSYLGKYSKTEEQCMIECQQQEKTSDIEAPGSAPVVAATVGVENKASHQ
mmetsp:Transcript_27524/g.35758  ORF Transcript_27524/g.35758 Transcript_27524/m.35758 type:complete len:178 (+) Transcript_27524:664-1197(+)